MKKLIITLCILIPLLSFAQGDIIISDSGIEAEVEPAGDGYQFKVTDDSYPAFDPAAADAGGYSHLWHTDEGHVSNAEKPIFFFESPGLHHVYLALTPRKQEDDDLKVFTTFLYSPGTFSDDDHGEIHEIDMYLDGEARIGDKIYVVVPLDHCQSTGIHNYRVGYDDEKLELLNVLSQSNLTVTADDTPLDDMAMGMDINRTIDFSYAWGTPRNDVAVVIEFEVLDRLGREERVEHISLKFHSNPTAVVCDSDVEIEFLAFDGGPYDPNYKESDISEVNVYENPDKKVSTTEVIYTIHFQNIGEAPVDSITVCDTLPPYLTFTSFAGSSEPGYMVGTSHVGGILTWVIAPDADIKGTNQNPSQPEPTTKGWVSFKAEIAKEQDITYSICHCLANVATIYFDELAPITTEADIIVIGDALCFSPDPFAQGQLYAQTICDPVSTSSARPTITSLVEGEEGETLFIAYPNPSNKAFQLKGELEKIQGIEILNYLGQKVLSLSKYETSISIDNQPPGLYFVRIITEDKQQIIRLEKH